MVPFVRFYSDKGKVLLSKRIKRVSAATLTLGALGAGAAHAVSIPGIDVYYASVVQGAGWGTTSWYDGRGLVAATYADKRSNSYTVYTNARFYQYRTDCAVTCSTGWKFVNQADGPNTSSSVSAYGLRGELSGRTGTYGVYYNVCADIPFQSDPCASRGRYGF